MAACLWTVIEEYPQKCSPENSVEFLIMCERSRGECSICQSEDDEKGKKGEEVEEKNPFGESLCLFFFYYASLSVFFCFSFSMASGFLFASFIAIIYLCVLPFP